MNITRYVVPLGKTAADYPTIIPQTGATVYVGHAAARTAMHAAGAAGWYGDWLAFVGDFTLADSAALACSTAAGTALSVNPTSGGNSIGGPQYGNNYLASSVASGVVFDLRFCTMDSRGAGSDNTKRAMACIAIQGEDFTVLLGENTRLYPPDYDYLQGAVASSGSSYADEHSLENCGILCHAGQGVNVLGPGMHWTYGWHIDGTDGFCRAGVLIYMGNNAASTTHRTCSVQGVNVTGCNNLIVCSAGGYGASGSTVLEGAGRIIRNNWLGRLSWGGPGYNNGGHHGQYIDAGGNFQGRTIISGNSCAYAAVVQDGIQAISTGSLICDNLVRTAAGTVNYWANAGAGVPYQSSTTTAAGNGIKAGLSGYAGTAGSTWLSAGTPGGNYTVAELNNIIARNEIPECGGIGVTANNGTGYAYLFNRVRASLAAFSISGGNNYVVGNYGVLDPNASAISFQSCAMSVETAAVRLFSYNNIWTTTRPDVCYDFGVQGGGSFSTGTTNARNVLANGRAKGTLTNYTIANDINGGGAYDIATWDWDTGWPQGHALLAGGSRAYLRDLRLVHGNTNALREVIGPIVSVGPI